MEVITIKKWRPGTTTPAPIREAPPPVRKMPKPPPIREPPAIIISYPQTGRKILPVGTTLIDVQQTKVTLPDGTEEPIYAARQIAACRSLLMYSDQPVDIKLTRRGTLLYASTIFPEWTRMTDAHGFANIEIETTEETVFQIILAEDPDGVPAYIPDHRLTPATSLGYNVAGDLIQIKKVIDGTEKLRIITNPDVVDNVVSKWVEHGEWCAI